MSRELLIDFSMLGYVPENCVVLDCSVCVVDPEKMVSEEPYTTRSVFAEVVRFKLSAADQVKRGMVAHPDGVDYWKSQPKATVDRVLKPSQADLDLDQFAERLIDHVAPQKIDRWWSRHAIDDAAVLWRLFHAVGKRDMLNSHLSRHGSRDLVTYLDSAFNFQRKKVDYVPIADVQYWEKIFQPQDSSHSVMADALRLQGVRRAELDLPMVER
jgi:hypothetical protein